ncbi:MAG TPA: hypothetical protein VKJ45_12865 [Blastocatellia bacterium]|nr:hypothetical protein [Blastocatellia bacterium]
MVVTRRTRAITLGILAVMLSTTVLMNYPSATAHSMSRPLSGGLAIRGQLRAAERPADGSLAVTPAPDTARAVSAIVTSDGGALTATAANGAVFTLTIPAGAIPDEETIRMTPIASIPDLPFSGGLAGAGAVQLEPEGLLLLKAATLVVQPSSPLPLDQQCPFSWHQAGDDFHLFPLTLDPGTITMQLTHFSGYGTGSGSSGERGAARASTPGTSTSQLEQRVQQLAEEARSKLSDNPTKKQSKKAVRSYKQELIDLLLSTFDTLLASLQSDLASGNETALRCDLVNVLGSVNLLHSYDLDLEILGVSGQFVPAVQAALQTLVAKARSRCPTNFNEIGNLLGLAKFGYLLAGTDSALSGLSSTARSAVDAAQQCGKLKLTFDSTETIEIFGTGGELTLDFGVVAGNAGDGVHLTPTIDADGVTLKYSGQAPLKHKDPKVSVSYCDLSSPSPTDSTLNIISMEINVKLREVDCSSPDSKIQLKYKIVFDVGRPMENLDLHCPNGAGYGSHGELWRAEFYCGVLNYGSSSGQFTITAQSGSQFTIESEISTMNNVSVPGCGPLTKVTTKIEVLPDQ